MKKLAALVLLVFASILLLPSLFSAYAEEKTAITTDWLYLRVSGRGSKVEYCVPPGTQLTLIGKPDYDGYYTILYEGQRLTAHESYMDITTSTTPDTTTHSAAAKVKTVKAELYAFNGPDEDPIPLFFVSSSIRLALRVDDEFNARVITWLIHGTPVLAIRTMIGNGFIKVRTLDGLEGFVHTDYLSKQPIADCEYQYEERDVDGIPCWAEISWQGPLQEE